VKSILITGSKGHLGSYIYDYFSKKNYSIITLDRELTLKKNSYKLSNFIIKNLPDVIINCAAIVGLQNSESQKKLTLDLNTFFPIRLANISKKNQINFIQISTNSSFEGVDPSINRTEDLKGIPKSFYAKTKHQADVELLKISDKFTILRISNLYSDRIQFNSNILNGILQNLKRNEVIIKRNEILSPVSAETVSKALEDIIINNAKGIYHCVDAGICSWEILISFICKKLNKTPKFKTIYEKNSRIINSTLSSKNSFCYYSDWKKGLEKSINNITNKYVQ
jgi:dTDP-4-dehydrorhamnose reductase